MFPVPTVVAVPGGAGAGGDDGGGFLSRVIAPTQESRHRHLTYVSCEYTQNDDNKLA